MKKMLLLSFFLGCSLNAVENAVIVTINGEQYWVKKADLHKLVEDNKKEKEKEEETPKEVVETKEEQNENSNEQESDLSEDMINFLNQVSEFGINASQQIYNNLPNLPKFNRVKFAKYFSCGQPIKKD